MKLLSNTVNTSQELMAREVLGPMGVIGEVTGGSISVVCGWGGHRPYGGSISVVF